VEAFATKLGLPGTPTEPPKPGEEPDTGDAE
jgi:hypothetical protein